MPESLLWQTVEEIEAGFPVISWETQVIRGIWHHEGVVFRDNNTRLFLEVPDTAENRAFFVELKERLKSRFHQLDIWVRSYLVDIT